MLQFLVNLSGFFGIDGTNAPKYILFGLFFIGAYSAILSQKLNQKLEPLKEDIKKIGSVTDKLEAFIIRLCGAIESGGEIEKVALYKSGSPLDITPQGYEALEKTGFKGSVDAAYDDLAAKIQKQEPQSAFDVEQISIGLIVYMMNDGDGNLFKEVKDYIFNHPEYNNSHVFKVAGLYLRDKFLTHHPELLPQPVLRA